MSQTVLITGASRGIGRAVALCFAKAGYDLALTCHQNISQLNEVIEEVKACSVRAAAYCFDAGDYEACAHAFHDICRDLGNPSILINNAGISHIGLFTDMTPDCWDRIIRTNLTSVYNMCHLVLPEMIRRQSGRIVNISSVWGNIGASCEVAYSASKGGINALTKALAKELAPSHICVNAVACGAVDTEMNRQLNEDERTALIDEIPACRMALPEEIGEFVLSLAHAPEYMTGQVITMDGGWT